MSEFHFLRPEWLLLLVPLFIFAWVYKRKLALSGQWQNVIAPQLQPYVLKQQESGKQKNIVSIGAMSAALFSIFAMAGPTWERQASPVYSSQAGLVIALDLSLSMTAQDTTPSRLKRAKFKITDILQQHQDKNIGLIAFAGDAHGVSPLTRDIKTIQSMLPALDPYIMPAQGSNYVAMAEQAINLFEQGQSEPRQLLIVTDGVEMGDIMEASQLLKQANIETSILAIGTQQGAPIVKPDGQFFKDGQGQVIMPPLEWDNLQSFSEQVNGRLQLLSSTDSDIQYLIPNTVKKGVKKTEEEAEFDQWLDGGYWLLIPVLLLSLGLFRKGVLLSIALIISIAPEETMANTITAALPDFLLNSDQQAYKQFDNKPKQASELFSDSDWKASSLYKAGKYEAALNIWKNKSDATSLYNQGNALAKLNRLQEAVDAYDKALKQKPGFEDAAFNKQLLENMLENQSQQDQQQNQDGQNSENSDQSQQDQQQNSQQQNAQNQSQQENQKQNQQSESQQSQSASEQQGQKNPNEQAQSDEEKANEEKMQQLRDAQKQAEEEKKEQQLQQQKQNQESDEQQNQQSAQVMTPEQLEQKQAMEQWIERIPDDPGGLLRNKFLYQYKNRQQTNQEGDRKPW